MSREILIVSDDARIKQLENKIDELTGIITEFLNEKQSIGDWITKEQALKLTGLGSTTLDQLKAEGKVRSSALTDRKIFFRRSDFERLLEMNQK